MNGTKIKKPIKKLNLETLDKQQERILSLMHEEQKRAKEKFPITYGLLATFGVACIFAGINRIITKIDLLNDHPVTLVVFGLAILLVTGAAYKKLG